MKYDDEPHQRLPLKVGLLMDTLTLPLWMATTLRAAVSEGTIVVSQIILNTDPDLNPTKATIARRASAWWRNRDYLLYAAFQKLDNARNNGPKDPLTPVSVDDLLAGVEVLHVSPRKTKFCDYLHDETVEKIRAWDLDIVLRAGFRIIKGEALRIARFGVWSFHHGDYRTNRGGPPGFWEVFEQRPSIGATLQQLTEELDNGIVLATAHSRVDRNSPARTRAHCYWDAAALLPREFRRIHEGRSVLSKPRRSDPWSAYDRPLYRAPGNGDVLRLLAKIGWRLVKAKAEHLIYKPQWFIAYSRRSGALDTPETPNGNLFQFREIEPTADRYWADPFPVVWGDRRWVFFEEHPDDCPNAHISVVELDSAGRPSPGRVVLKRDYHLSFPFVFQHNDEFYMIPETKQTNQIELFRAVEFPNRWEFVRPLVSNIAAADTSFAEIDGRWWLFTGVELPNSDDATALHIFHAATPLGPWTAHADNPVRIDVHSGRPAGKPFRVGPHWYRPGQDGALRYGRAVSVYRIDKITPTDYLETPVAHLSPNWRKGLIGTHTINCAGGLTVIDALQKRLRLLG